MSDPVQVIVAAFSDPDTAGQVMSDLKQGKKEGLIGIVDAAVVVKDADGKVKVTDAKHRTTKGLATGGVIGAVVGLIAAPAVLTAAIGGGVIGGLIGKLKSAPLKAEMKSIGSGMPPNSSAIVAAIRHDWVSQLQMALELEGARLVHDTIQADIAAQLSMGGNVMYTAGSGNLGTGAIRVDSNDLTSEFDGILIGEDGVLVDNAIMINEPLEEEAAVS